MPNRSKRETAPPPLPLPNSSPFVHGAPPASMKATPGSTPPGAAWWCGTPVPPPVMPPTAWWPTPSCGGGVDASSSQLNQKDDINSDPNEWGVDNRPPGGFLSCFNGPWSQPQPIRPHLADGKRGKGKSTVSVSGSHPPPQSLINLDNDDDDGSVARIDIRLKYTKPEEVRLVVAWVNNSNDPINGNGKKTDRYWGDVANEYNSTTPKSRRRTAKQLKDHFQKIKKKVTWFCSSWKEAVSIWPSGHSDDQIMEKAEAIYEEYKDGKFPFKHCWKILRDEPFHSLPIEEIISCACSIIFL